MSASASPGGLLLGQLARAVGVASTCIPAEVSDHDPRLDEVAAELDLGTTRQPSGDEDVLCQLAADGGPERLRAALIGFQRAPFVLLIGATAAESADALLGPAAEWLALAESPPETQLLAPVPRALGVTDLPWEWTAAAPDAAPLSSDNDALSALWLAAEHDRAALEAITDRIDLSARRLEEARGARERMNAEVARMREAERHELDRMRLALLEQRAWVADQAMRVAQSQSWRVGHRLVRIGRLLAFKRDRGTDLPTAIARAMEDGDFR
jgi:hypothetical protein